MKLSAPPPPPPPPEPNEPGQPNPDETPGVPGADQGANAPQSPEAAEQTAQKALAWPAWFAGADFLLTVLVLALAFLVASFVARNSDAWLHLAAGKRLLAGEYSPGSDPFSYSAADRTWVNHSILYDAVTYLLYSGTGSLLVILKALAVVAAFGLLLALRRPGFSLWPWACVALVAVVAVAPYALLRPLVGSIFLFALTLFLLFRGPHRAGSWRFPIAIGVTFWVWANVDEWFFLGPLALALVLVGELIQRALAKSGDATDTGEPEPLGSLPDVPTLARALCVGVVACMLNPHHINVWQLPMELVGAKDLVQDIRFRQLMLSPLDAMYREQKSVGYNVNGLAYAVLLVAGGLALGLAGGRLRFALLLLWMGVAVLSLWTVLAIPFLALVAVPLVASELNKLSSRCVLKSWGDPRSRLLYLGSGVGRILVLIAVIVACVLAWPGWMHPQTPNEAYARRVAWAIEPDAAMVRGAEELQAWRTGEQPRLAAETRGLIASLEFANYCAWFAPSEKVYANGRYAHHRREFSAFMRVRAALDIVQLPAEQKPGTKELAEVLEKVGAEYVVLHSGPGDSSVLRELTRIAANRQWLNSEHWSPWYLDGRTTVCGWRSKPGAERPTFYAMRLDPVVLAFGPQVKPLRVTPVTEIRRAGGWEESFLRSPKVSPTGGDEALAWNMYKSVGEQQRKSHQVALAVTFSLTDRLVGGAGVAFAPARAAIELLPPNETMLSAPILSLRAAVAAISADRDHPDGYFALANALSDPQLPLEAPERILWQITALRQCLHRLPPPEEFRSGVYLASPTQVCYALSSMYLGRRREFGGALMGFPTSQVAFQLLNGSRGTNFLRAGAVPIEGIRGRPERAWVGGRGTPRGPTYLLPLDEARELLLLAQKYLRVEPPNNEETLRGLQKELDRELQEVEAELGRMNNRYDLRKGSAGGQMKLAAQVEAALEFNLVGEALRLLTDKDTDLAKEFGPRVLEVAMSMVALQLALGHLEDASKSLDVLTSDATIQQALSSDQLRLDFQKLRFHKLMMECNFAEAGSFLEGLQGEFIRQDAEGALRQQFNPKPFAQSQQLLVLWEAYPAFSSLLSPSPLEASLRTFGRNALFHKFALLRNNLGGVRQNEGEFYLQRGMLSLYEGDIKAARARFLQTRSTPEQKAEDARWGLPERRYENAETYLRLIDEAAKRAGPK